MPNRWPIVGSPRGYIRIFEADISCLGPGKASVCISLFVRAKGPRKPSGIGWYGHRALEYDAHMLRMKGLGKTQAGLDAGLGRAGVRVGVWDQDHDPDTARA